MRTCTFVCVCCVCEYHERVRKIIRKLIPRLIRFPFPRDYRKRGKSIGGGGDKMSYRLIGLSNLLNRADDSSRSG